MKAHIWFFSDEQKEEVFDIINFHFNDDFIEEGIWIRAYKHLSMVNGWRW